MKNMISSQTSRLATLKVISQSADSVKVLLPKMDIPVIMTNKYFNYIKNTGAYMIMYCVAI